MSRILRHLSALLTVFMFGACTLLRHSHDSHVIVETRAFAGECLLSADSGVRSLAAGPIAEAIIPSLISTSLNAIDNALKEASKEIPFEEKSIVNIADGTTLPACLQLVRAKFFTNANTYSKENSNFTLKLGIERFVQGDTDAESDQNLQDLNNSIRDRLVALGIYLAGQPFVLLEAALETTKDRSGVAIRPTIFIYNERIGKAWHLPLRDPPTLAIGFSAMSAESTEGTLKTIVIRDAVAPIVAIFDQAREIRIGGWETPWFKLPQGGGSISLILSVRENYAPSKTIKFISEVFSGSKDSLETALKQATLEKEKEALKTKEKDAEDKLRQAAETDTNAAFDKYFAAQQALDACVKGSAVSNINNLKLLTDYRKARLTAINAAAKANNPKELDIKTDLPEKNACP